MRDTTIGSATVFVLFAMVLLISHFPNAVADPIFSVAMQTTTHDPGPSEYYTLDLASVSVLRGACGLQTIDVDDLIPITVDHFKTDKTTVLARPLDGPVPSPGGRAAMLEDVSLNTGFTNPGYGTGLTAPPIMNEPDSGGTNTPGMAISFDQPVVNNPGPDLVLFELDSGDPDPVVISPLDAGQPGRQSHTFSPSDYAKFGPDDNIKFYHHNMSPAPTSLGALESGSLGSVGVNNNFELYGVALDLSDLGYAAGEAAPGLFFQAADTSNMWDPTLIAGLPSPAPLVTDDLILHYRAENADGKGNPGSGSQTSWKNLDDSGSAYDGELMNFEFNYDPANPRSGWYTQTAGHPWQHALDLRGDNDYINVATPLALDEDDFSYEFWMKADSTNGNMALIGEFDSSTSNSYTKNFFRMLDGGILSRDSYPDSGGAHNTGAGFVNVDEFVQVVVTKSGDVVTFYLNGDEEVFTVTGSDLYTGSTPDVSWIGARRQSNSVVWAFNGQFSVIRVYGRALTADEVMQNYAIETIPEPSSLLLMAIGLLVSVAVRKRRCHG